MSTDHGTTRSGAPFTTITCDGCGLHMHAVGAGLARLQAIIAPTGDGRHHCPGCRAALGPCPPANDGDLEQLLRLSATVQIPHPEHG